MGRGHAPARHCKLAHAVRRGADDWGLDSLGKHPAEAACFPSSRALPWRVRGWLAGALSRWTGLRVRCVCAEVRWHWTLKVLKIAAWVDRNFCAEPTLLKRCILSFLRLVG